VEGQSADVDTEEGVPTQHFHVSIIEVKCLVRSHCRGVDERLVVRSVCKRGTVGMFVIRSICDREVGQSGDADGGGLLSKPKG